MAKKVDQRGMPLKTYDSHKRVASTSFAAVLLIIVGVFHLLQGFGALLSDADFTTFDPYRAARATERGPPWPPMMILG